jgi:hypothetical protein
MAGSPHMRTLHLFWAHSEIKTAKLHNHIFIDEVNLEASHGFPWASKNPKADGGGLEVSKRGLLIHSPSTQLMQDYAYNIMLRFMKN